MATKKYKLNDRGYYEAKVWDGTYTASGAKHRKTLRSKKSSADLERQVMEFKAKVNGTPVAEINLTFGEYSHKWLDLYKSNKELNTQRM